jgi:hypothetical protein
VDHKKISAVFQFEELTEQERSAFIPTMNPRGLNNNHLSKIPESLLAKTPDHRHKLPIPWSITAIQFMNLSRPKKKRNHPIQNPTGQEYQCTTYELLFVTWDYVSTAKRSMQRMSLPS